MDGQRVAVATAGNERPHERVGFTLQDWFRSIAPLEPTGADQVQLTHAVSMTTSCGRTRRDGRGGLCWQIGLDSGDGLARLGEPDQPGGEGKTSGAGEQR